MKLIPFAASDIIYVDKQCVTALTDGARLWPRGTLACPSQDDPIDSEANMALLDEILRKVEAGE